MLRRWGRQERKQGRGVTYDIRQEAGPQNRSAPARQTWKQSIAGGGNSRWVIGAPAPGLTARLEGRGEEAAGAGGAGEALRTGPGPRSGLTDDARCSRWCLSQFPAGLFIHPVASELLEGVVITPILHVRTLRLEKGGAVSHALSAGGRALLPQVRGGKWPPGQHPGWDSGYSALSMWHQTGREKDGEVGEGANAPEPVRARPIFAGIWG